MTVSGKRIVVTGAARGIGAGLTALLRERGATVITADLNPVGVDVACDVSDPAQVETLFSYAGEIDGLVNNAALLVGRRPYDEIPLDEWDQMFAVNVRGSYLCAKSAAASMKGASGGAGGAIVNIASETAFTGSHGFAHYVASKGAIVSLTRALANELGAHGIRVRCSLYIRRTFTAPRSDLPMCSMDRSATSPWVTHTMMSWPST